MVIRCPWAKRCLTLVQALLLLLLLLVPGPRLVHLYTIQSQPVLNFEVDVVRGQRIVGLIDIWLRLHLLLNVLILLMLAQLCLGLVFVLVLEQPLMNCRLRILVLILLLSRD